MLKVCLKYIRKHLEVYYNSFYFLLVDTEDTGEMDDILDLDYTPAKRTRRAKTYKAKSSTIEWTDEEVLELISCVEVRPPLWNAGDGKYKNRNERNKFWDEISEIEFESKYGSSQLQSKWSNLRIQYRSYLTKKPKSGQAANAEIQWKFFAPMSFVGRTEAEQTAPTESNLPRLNVSLNFFNTFILFIPNFHCVPGV